MHRGKKIINGIVTLSGIFLLLLMIGIVSIKIVAYIDAPPVKDQSSLKLERVDEGKDFYTLKNNWFRKSKSGLYELYVEGEPFEMGVINQLFFNV